VDILLLTDTLRLLLSSDLPTVVQCSGVRQKLENEWVLGWSIATVLHDVRGNGFGTGGAPSLHSNYLTCKTSTELRRNSTYHSGNN
jgi:hypothetical protein